MREKKSFKYLVSTFYPAQLTEDSIVKIHYLQDSQNSHYHTAGLLCTVF